MSGLAVAFGEPRTEDVEGMLRKMGHRGPYLSGIFSRNRIAMGQNYLRAETHGAPEDQPVPVSRTNRTRWTLCYDGQMGNGRDLSRRFTVADGPFSEERVLLKLYAEKGADMLGFLDDGVFAFVISDGDDFFAARDMLGIKTLFYGRKGPCLYLATELKGLVGRTDDIHEFPPGHYMDRQGRLTRFAGLPHSPPEQMHTDLDTILREVRRIIEKSVRARVDFRVPTASLLSGGMDSSVIAYLSDRALKEHSGPDARLHTFALGTPESGDIESARLMADHLESEHHEVLVGLEDILEVLPEVIYYLESFDPSLVRSAVSNFLISGHAKRNGVEVLLSGEGGDEIFCGYNYLKPYPLEELFQRQMECLGFLHNNASLRLDRMNQCHSVCVVAPLISGELFRYALGIPPQYKQRPDKEQKTEKWIFRKAYEHDLPESITWRLKQEFSQGSGSAGLLPVHFEKTVSDKELVEAQGEFPFIRSKEELHYFKTFTGFFGTGGAVETVGQWVTL